MRFVAFSGRKRCDVSSVGHDRVAIVIRVPRGVPKTDPLTGSLGSRREAVNLLAETGVVPPCPRQVAARRVELGVRVLDPARQRRL